MKALLAAPDRRDPQGFRDYALMLFLYNTGARASEASRLMVGDLDLVLPTATLHGKDAKPPVSPLEADTHCAPRTSGPPPYHAARVSQSARAGFNPFRHPHSGRGLHAPSPSGSEGGARLNASFLPLSVFPCARPAKNLRGEHVRGRGIPANADPATKLQPKLQAPRHSNARLLPSR